MKRRLLLASAAAALSGCGLAERPYAERRQWPLVVPRPTALPARRRGKVLLVRNVRASAGLERRGLQVLHPDGSLQVMFYEEWSVLPADGVGDALQRWLVESGLFGAVIGSGSRESPDLVLESELQILQADLAAGTGRATLSIVLSDPRATLTPIRLQETEHGRAPIQGDDAPAYVAAQRAALVEVFSAVERAIAPFA